MDLTCHVINFRRADEDFRQAEGRTLPRLGRPDAYRQREEALGALHAALVRRALNVMRRFGVRDVTGDHSWDAATDALLGYLATRARNQNAGKTYEPLEECAFLQRALAWYAKTERSRRGWQHVPSDDLDERPDESDPVDYSWRSSTERHALGSREWSRVERVLDAAHALLTAPETGSRKKGLDPATADLYRLLWTHRVLLGMDYSEVRAEILCIRPDLADLVNVGDETLRKYVHRYGTVYLGRFLESGADERDKAVVSGLMLATRDAGARARATPARTGHSPERVTVPARRGQEFLDVK